MLSRGASIEVLECDKTGHVREKWLQTPDGRVVSVITYVPIDN